VPRTLDDFYGLQKKQPFQKFSKHTQKKKKISCKYFKPVALEFEMHINRLVSSTPVPCILEFKIEKAVHRYIANPRAK
jgi:hypothetical protein